MREVKLDSSKMLMPCRAANAARNDKGVTLGGNDRRQSRRIYNLSQKDKIPQRIENA